MAERTTEGRLQKLKGKVQSTWGQITDDDFARAEGNRDQLVGTIREKTGQAEEEIRRMLDDIEREDEK